MQDFNDYVNNCGQEKKGGDDLFNLVNALAGQFDGKSQNELMYSCPFFRRQKEKNARQGSK